MLYVKLLFRMIGMFFLQLHFHFLISPFAFLYFSWYHKDNDEVFFSHTNRLALLLSCFHITRLCASPCYFMIQVYTSMNTFMCSFCHNFCTKYIFILRFLKCSSIILFASFFTEAAFFNRPSLSHMFRTRTLTHDCKKSI